jgi:putative spermidine/putrescine transport system ATP-binding protein
MSRGEREAGVDEGLAAADEAAPLVRFIGVEKSFDGRTLVVRALDLDVAAGEFLTLLGPSGSGKTTTLLMLAGFEAPTRGEILLAGRPLAGVPPHRRGVGMVFQNYALFPHMSVAENVAFPLSVRRVGRAETAEEVARALDMVRLAGLEARRPAQLSGGQQQRVALARALVFEPQLVLMDEPLGALDKQLREQMQLEIKHIHERLGVTVVYVTHDQSEALTMSDRIAVFRDGAVRQVGGPRQLYEEPANAFVAGFVGENNALSGTVEERRGAFCAVRLDCGARVQARAVGAEAGAACVVALRPERAALGAEGGNRLAATAVETIYHGDHARLRLRLADGTDFMLKSPSGAPLPAPGEPATISFRPEHARAFPLG